MCARDSSLCARVILGGKNDAKLCLCAPECVRGGPPDLIGQALMALQVEKCLMTMVVTV